MSSKEELLSVAGDLGEVAIDSVLQEGIFKDIPVVGIGLSVAKLLSSASDKILLNKLLAFIKELDFKSQEEIDDFKRKYFKDSDYVKIGSQLLFIIERSDSQLKLKWLARLLRLFVNKDISKTDYLRMANSVNNCFPDDLWKLLLFKNTPEIRAENKVIESYILDHLFSIGFLESHGFDGGGLSGNSDSGTIYALNKFGKILVDQVLSPPIN